LRLILAASRAASPCGQAAEVVAYNRIYQFGDLLDVARSALTSIKLIRKKAIAAQDKGAKRSYLL
jgi:hypothetical protein